MKAWGTKHISPVNRKKQMTARELEVIEHTVKMVVTAFGMALRGRGFGVKRLTGIFEDVQNYLTENIAQYTADDVLPEKVQRDIDYIGINFKWGGNERL